VSNAADEILEAGIRDAKAALLVIQGFDAQWRTFASACQMQEPDLASIYGARLVSSIEAAVDLYLASHRRMSQFAAMTQGPKE
jgi:hypothetical protein